MKATKNEFDLVLLTIGYNTYAMPKAAALQFLDASSSGEIYRWDSAWVSEANRSEFHAWPIGEEEMPSLRLLNPAKFHQALELKRKFEEDKKAKNAG